MYFQNRQEAARQLAERLQPYRGRHPLVLAIPRGAVPMGAIIADRLEGDLDVVLVRKLGAPGNPELAVGSVDESGRLFVGYARELGVSDAYLEEEKRTQLEVIRRRRAMYTPIRPPLDPAGRTVIVLDDGVATGATMIAALRAVRDRHPAKLVAATAVASRETVRRLGAEADEVVCLHAPESFMAIGEFFADFSAVSDEQVCAILRERAAGRPPAARKAG
ncbi:MAG: phosphoribosyltransferase [Acidobacteriota bacterium]|nr:phosphoribosyltransferase [Acidobacteriota bacterium]